MATSSAEEQRRRGVAFARPAGVHLVEPELRRLRDRARLLVTTQFGTTTASALGRASSLGVEVRLLDPAGSRTYHPKLYVGRSGSRIAAVVGSANLTAGLVSNIEAACVLEGTARDAALRDAWARAEEWWGDRAARPWLPSAVAEPLAGAEPDWGVDPALFGLVESAVARDREFRTLGRETASNGRDAGRDRQAHAAHDHLARADPRGRWAP